jgi:hypothetical protein
MKRLGLVIALLLCASLAFSFSPFPALSLFDNEEKTVNDNWTGNFGMSFYFPIDKKYNPAENILAAAFLSSFTGGVGGYLNAVPDVFCPGIYVEAHITWLGFTYQKSYNEENEDFVFFFVQFGARLFNQFRFESFDIQPFAGANFAFASHFNSGAVMFGILAAYKSFGIEYSFHIPFPRFDRTFLNDNAHRLVLALHRR